MLGAGKLKNTAGLHSAPRCAAKSKRTGQPCGSPAVTGYKVCRMHGAGGGAPSGAKNGNYRHGNETRASKDLRAEMMTLIRECRETLDAI